jgi:hypothetical protein
LEVTAMKPARKAFLLRMDPALYETLERWAAAELRSLNGQIEYLLKEAVVRQRKISPDKLDPPQPPDEATK